MNLEKSRYFLDSNVFFYAKIGDKKYGKCCAEIIKAVFEGKIDAYIDSVILSEVANSLRKFFTSNVVAEEINAILSLPIRVIDVKKEDILESLKQRVLLSPYDSLHYFIAGKYNAKIISADKDFDTVGRIDPCQFTSSSTR